VKPFKDISWLKSSSLHPNARVCWRGAGGKYSGRQTGRSLECCHPQTSFFGLSIIILYYCCVMFASHGQILLHLHFILFIFFWRLILCLYKLYFSILVHFCSSTDVYLCLNILHHNDNCNLSLLVDLSGPLVARLCNETSISSHTLFSD
jgi:hypothetical protein